MFEVIHNPSNNTGIGKREDEHARPCTEDELEKLCELANEAPTSGFQRVAPGYAKITQLLKMPDNSTWQGVLLGLDSTGVVHELDNDGKWKPFIEPLK